MRQDAPLVIIFSQTATVMQSKAILQLNLLNLAYND